MSDLRATSERFNRDRDRLTPRIVKVIVAGDGSLATIVFKDKMDQTRSTGVFRVCSQALDAIVDFDGFGWTDERTLKSGGSNTVQVGYTGPTFARYMSGSIRARARFNLSQGTRVDRIE